MPAPSDPRPARPHARERVTRDGPDIIPTIPMDGQRWQRIEQLYHEALERPRGEQGAFLDRACGGDHDLRVEVASLLDQSAEGVLDRPVWQAVGSARYDVFDDRHDRPDDRSLRNCGPAGRRRHGRGLQGPRPASGSRCGAQGVAAGDAGQPRIAAAGSCRRPRRLRRSITRTSFIFTISMRPMASCISPWSTSRARRWTRRSRGRGCRFRKRWGTPCPWWTPWRRRTAPASSIAI